MKFSKHLKKTLSIVLTITIILTGYGISTLANTVQVNASSEIVTEIKKQEKSKSKKVTKVKEIKSERTENSNTYLMSNGSKKLEIYGEAVRYKEDGKWVDYDATLTDLEKDDREKLDKIVEDVDRYEKVNAQGDVKHYFPNKLDEEGIVMSKKNYAFSFTPILKEKSVEEEATLETKNKEGNEETSTEAESLDVVETTEIIDTKSEAKIAYIPEVNEDTIIYSSENSDIQYEYISLNNGVKENIILSSKPETYEFTFKIVTKNLKLEESEIDKSIYLLDKKTDKYVGYIMAPNITDGEGNVNYEDIKYELEKTNEETILKLVVEEEYFENEDLAYPVKIDPTPVWFSDKMPTAMVNDVIADQNLHSSTLHASNKAGASGMSYICEYRAYLDTSKIPEGDAFVNKPGNINGKYIVDATLSIAETAPSFTKGTIEIRKPKDIWNPQTITWNTQPEVGELIASFESKSVEGTYHTIDLTEWAQGIATGQIEDTGLVFIAPEEGEGISFRGPELSDRNYMWLSITYYDIAQYDGSVSIDAEYNEETGKIDVSAPEYEELAEGVTITGYKVYERRNDEDKFIVTATNDDITTGTSLEVDTENTDKTDIRVCIAYSNGTVKSSNIVTLEKYEEEVEEETTELPDLELPEASENEELSARSAIVEIPGNSNTETIVYFEQTTTDTDGDGLEDGYEIWDFKTLWNTETSESTTDNKIYDLDTDDDGLPDSYEVFTLGTDPAVANNENTDSDGDGTIDLDEWSGTRLVEQEIDGEIVEVEKTGQGTDPWLADSDFDGLDDSSESGDALRKSSTINQVNASEAEVHIGLYDRQYSETENGVTYTYVESIYKGETKQIRYDYGNTELNKTIKYFYDEKGNNTAIIEQYDRGDEYKNDPEYANTVCITYTYNDNNDVTYICDQGNKYNMSYKDGEMTSLKVGNQEIISYDNSYTVENEDSDSLAIGSVIDRTVNTTTYGPTRENNVITDNEGVIKTVTTTYKVAEDDVTSTQTVQEIYYDNSENISYKTEYTSEGDIKAFYDYTNVVEETDSPITYTYTYTDSGVTVSREGFSKTVTTETSDATEGNETIEGEEETTVDGESATVKSSTTTTSYSFKDIKNNDVTYTSSITSTENDGNSYEEKVVLHNGDTSNFSYNETDKKYISNIYSELYDIEVLKTTQTEVSNASTTFAIEKYAEDKNIKYTYDLAGNIVEIKVDGVVLYKYTYDAHGRLRTETDYKEKRYHEYRYGDTGNMSKHRVFKISDDGSIATSPLKEMAMTYDTDGNWKDQLVSYNGKTIEYNKAGNPTSYLDEMTFTWSRGRQLSGIVFDDGTETQTESEEPTEYDVTYKYNQNGLRTYKDTSDTETTYEWDESTLVRETVKYKATDRIYDIWYFYDSNGDAIGFEYSFVNDVNGKSTTRIYYEKDLQGNVIGLLDCRGAEIATYFYDAWGNITDSMCYEGYEVPFALNHITYRGYYRDEETGFYYLQSRYYDAEICRFINADDISFLGSSGTVWGYNLFIYCESNPVLYVDPKGQEKIVYDEKYNRNKVANYAEKWATKYNTKKYYKAGLDCTNFVSQCLAAGGKRISSTLPTYANTNYWRPHSATWENADYFRKYWTKKVPSGWKKISKMTDKETYAYATKLYWMLFRGDVIQYGYGAKDMKHSQICYEYGRSESGYSTLIMAQHTDNRKGIALHDYLKQTYYTHIRYYKMRYKK